VVKKYRTIFKEEGFKGVIRKAGWPAAIGLFLFFLIKGLLWLLIPYLLAKGCING
jgi:hypothetical protein